ncbi:MAG TPA: hypothetical protein ENK72_01200 [Epsilonproteobacteria bacterium]|nr:hypothetical protein [Campylobacterota bacterium]
MKGIVFTELIEFVEEALGFEIADQMIGNAGLANEGAFTQAGNYPFEDLQKLVVRLSAATGKPAGDLLYLFGQYLFGRLIKLYPV